MIRLDSTKKLQAYLDGAVATTQPQVSVSYSDQTATTYNGASTLSTLNGVTEVDICTAPAAGTIRDIDFVSIVNRDTADVVVYVVVDVATVEYRLLKVTLDAGDQVEYTHGSGWRVLDQYGSLKTVLTTPTPVLYLDLTPTTAPAYTEGRVWYDSATNSLAFYTDISTSVANLPYETWIRVRNQTGSTITNGSPVVLSGATGQTPTIALADADVHHAHECIGIMTNDIGNNTVNIATILGEVRDINTTGSGANKLTDADEVWNDGDTLYVSQTAGKLTNVAPVWPAAAISIGVVSYSHATNGKILVSVGDAQEYLTGEQADGKINKTGIDSDDSGNYLTTLTYNETTRTVTISPTGASFDVYVLGVKYTKTAQTLSHAATGSSHFFYFDETGTFVTSTSPWNLLKHAPVAFVFQDFTNNRRICFEERHHSGRDVWWHRNQHTAEGTKATSGFAISGYLLSDGSTDAAVSFAIASGRLEDEDIRVDTEALADGGPYTLLYRSGVSGDWLLDRTSVLPFYYSGSNLQYNQFTGATWQLTNLAEDTFVNYYVFGVTALPSADVTPAPGAVQQFVIIPGQATYATQALANAETVGSLAWGSIPFQEICPLYQITMRYNATAPAAYTNTARCAFMAVTRIVGATAASLAAGSPATDHGSLSGLGDDDHTQYLLADGTRSLTGNLTVTGTAANYFAGSILSGTTTSTNNLASEQKLALVAAGTGVFPGLSSVAYSGTSASAAPIVDWKRSRGTTDGSLTAVASGDALGYFRWWGADGAAFVRAAQISAQIDGTPGTNDMPGRLLFSTTADGASSPTERLRIDSSGQVGIGLTPTARNNTRLQIVDGIGFPATQVASSDANTLDDYEEGTFTPTIRQAATAGTGSYAANGQVGRYTKIGNRVYFQLWLSWTNLTGGTGDLRVASLPFTSANVTNLYSAVDVGYVDGLAVTAGNYVTAYMMPNSSLIVLAQVPTGGGSNVGIPLDTAATVILSGHYEV